MIQISIMHTAVALDASTDSTDGMILTSAFIGEARTGGGIIIIGTILGSIAIALGGLIHLASTARLGDSAGAGEAFMPAIIVRGTIHGMARLGAGVEAIGVAIGDIITITIPVTTRLQVDIIQTDVPLIEIIALMRVAEVPVIQVGGAVALLP